MLAKLAVVDTNLFSLGRSVRKADMNFLLNQYLIVNYQENQNSFAIIDLQLNSLQSKNAVCSVNPLPSNRLIPEPVSYPSSIFYIKQNLLIRYRI